MRWFPLGAVRPGVHAVILATIALSQMVFALGGLIGLVDGMVAAAGTRHPLQDVLAAVVFSATVGAGVLLWRGRPAGLALSLGVQSLQVFSVIVHHTAIRFVAGPHVTWHGTFPRIWAPYGVEGSFVAVARPEFPPLWMGINLVALAVVVYLTRVLLARRRAVAQANEEGAGAAAA